MYKVKKETISRLIKNLAEQGYIQVELIYTGKEITGRKIYINKSIPIDEKINTYCSKSHEGNDEKINTPIDQKVKENNTLINNTINTTLDKKEKRTTEIDKLICDYSDNLNLRNTLCEFVKMRKSIKATITTVGLKRLLSRLDSLANSDEEKIRILDNSIMNSWKGVFPLKNDSTSKNGELKFNNFESREYDYDDLEKKLLGWDTDKE